MMPDVSLPLVIERQRRMLVMYGSVERTRGKAALVSLSEVWLSQGGVRLLTCNGDGHFAGTLAAFM